MWYKFGLVATFRLFAYFFDTIGVVIFLWRFVSLFILFHLSFIFLFSFFCLTLLIYRRFYVSIRFNIFLSFFFYVSIISFIERASEMERNFASLLKLLSLLFLKFYCWWCFVSIPQNFNCVREFFCVSNHFESFCEWNRFIPTFLCISKENYMNFCVRGFFINFNMMPQCGCHSGIENWIAFSLCLIKYV